MNGNPFQKASKLEKRLKICLYGRSGAGKTRLALRFPKPCVVDLEHGSDLYGGEFDFEVIKTHNADEIIRVVNWLASAKHEYRTLVIDPVTMFWESLQKKYMEIFLRTNKKSPGNRGSFYILQPQDWGVIKSEWKDFIRKVLALDMNVICIAREKNLYKDGEFMEKVGSTFDAEKGLDYYFDTVIQVTRDGANTFGIAEKDRTYQFPAYPNRFALAYDIFEKILGNSNGFAPANPTAPAPPKDSNKPARGIPVQQEPADPLPEPEEPPRQIPAITEQDIENKLRGDMMWINDKVPFKAAGGATWDDLGKNLASPELRDGKVVPGRQYLHQLENWSDEAGGRPEVRIKAKLALEQTDKELKQVQQEAPF